MLISLALKKVYFEKFIHKGLDMANETLRHSYVAYVYLCVYMDNHAG
jgi:hypothetical protein